MLTIDAQVHAYERDRPGRPWLAALHGPAEVTGDQMVAAMDAVGVDGALLVSPFTMYGYDASYAREVHAKHRRRFGLIRPVDPGDPAVADTIAAWAATATTKSANDANQMRRAPYRSTPTPWASRTARCRPPSSPPRIAPTWATSRPRESSTTSPAAAGTGPFGQVG